MASFKYEAINTAGKIMKGSVEAETPERAREEVKRMGYTPVSVTVQGVLDKDINIGIKKRPSARDLSVFCRQFVSMLRAGVTIMDALKMLSEATENSSLRTAIQQIRISTEKGEPLSTAFGEHPDVFPELMEKMVAAGEASGSLDVAVERMANQYERNSKTQAMIKKAMVYPIVVVIVAFAVVVVMLTVVIPNYVNMFDDLGTELPAITVGVQKLSNFVIDYWYILFPAIAAVVILIVVFSKTEKGKYFFGNLALKFPMTKGLVTKSASAQMARTMSTLMAAGIPLVEATGIVSEIMGNPYFRDAMSAAQDEITIGQPLSRPLEECGLFPPMVYFMTRIGEETGNSEEMLDKLADYYEEEVEMAVASLMAALEPVIIIVLAAIVIVLLGACMAPMLTMYEALDSM